MTELMDTTDPPLEPRAGTMAWIESSSEVLLNDPAMAGLMVRIGMAVNALTVHLNLGYEASQRTAEAVRERDNLVSLVMAAALAFEALELARKNQRLLRPLVQRIGDRDELLTRVGTLLAGRHPASELLERARNSLAFHFDYEDEFIGPLVRDFARNQKIVWVEEVPSPEANTVHRLAVEVLAHALIPDANSSDPDLQRAAVNTAIANVIDALNTLAEYFTAAVVRYLGEQGVTLRKRS